MAKWSRQQIAVMARASGWGARSEDVSWVAMAESGGDSKVVNEIGCVGLLQINQPVHVKSHPKWTVKWLQDPMNNLAAGLVLFKAAGNSFDAPWADSKTKGGIPEGWGPHVSGSGSTGATQTADDPCAYLKGTAGYEPCRNSVDKGEDYQDNPPGDGSLADTALQIGRLAQAVAKAGNWLANPGNWVRVAYVVGGGVLAITAVSVVVRPYAARGYREVTGALPIKSTRRYLDWRRANQEASEGQS